MQKSFNRFNLNFFPPEYEKFFAIKDVITVYNKQKNSSVREKK